MDEPVYFIVKSVPDLCLNPNRSRRAHWAALANAIASLRQSTCYDVHEQGFPRKLIGPLDAWACICWPAANRRLTDGHNATMMLKPVWDGLQDAGLYDDDKQLTVIRVEQYVLTKSERAHYPRGCIVLAAMPGQNREVIPPLDKYGNVSQPWLDGIPRS